MPIVTADKDLPKLLDSPAKQVKWAKKLVAEHLGSSAKRFDKPPMQGMFSRTLFVTLADGREVVVQFRTEPLDVDAFKIAKGALDSFVPDAEALGNEELENAGAWTYSLARMSGYMESLAREPKGELPSTSHWAASFRRVISLIIATWAQSC